MLFFESEYLVLTCKWRWIVLFIISKVQSFILFACLALVCVLSNILSYFASTKVENKGTACIFPSVNWVLSAVKSIVSPVLCWYGVKIGFCCDFVVILLLSVHLNSILASIIAIFALNCTILRFTYWVVFIIGMFHKCIILLISGNILYFFAEKSEWLLCILVQWRLDWRLIWVFGVMVFGLFVWIESQLLFMQQ